MVPMDVIMSVLQLCVHVSDLLFIFSYTHTKFLRKKEILNILLQLENQTHGDGLRPEEE